MRHDIGEGSAFVIRDLFDAVACATWRARAESVGFEENAPVTTRWGPQRIDDVRNNARAMCDRPEWANELWSTLHPLFPTFDGIATPIGLNERFRFYRYRAGQFFAPHKDGAFRRDATEESLWTVLIYLTGGVIGGETRLLRHGVDIRPEAGTLLAFLHRQPHEGASVLSGEKVVLRTDVMYRLTR